VYEVEGEVKVTMNSDVSEVKFEEKLQCEMMCA